MLRLRRVQLAPACQNAVGAQRRQGFLADIAGVRSGVVGPPAPVEQAGAVAAFPHESAGASGAQNADALGLVGPDVGQAVQHCAVHAAQRVSGLLLRTGGQVAAKHAV